MLQATDALLLVAAAGKMINIAYKLQYFRHVYN